MCFMGLVFLIKTCVIAGNFDSLNVATDDKIILNYSLDLNKSHFFSLQNCCFL